MTIKGTIMLPFTGYCPDRWKYEYDGKILTLTEEWDNIPDDAIAMTVIYLQKTMDSVTRNGNSIIAGKKTEQLQAIAGLVAEAIGQGNIANILQHETRDKVFREITDYFRSQYNIIGASNVNSKNQ